MKKKTFLLTALISLFLLSCSSDDKYETPSIEGKWTIESRVVETNYKDKDVEINNYLFHDASIITTEKLFEKGILKYSRYNKSSGKEIFFQNYTYIVMGDDIQYTKKEEKVTTVTTVRTHIGKNSLTTSQQVDAESIKGLLGEIEQHVDLPKDIKGEYRTLEHR